jgi:hypothetical protein
MRRFALTSAVVGKDDPGALRRPATLWEQLEGDAQAQCESAAVVLKANAPWGHVAHALGIPAEDLLESLVQTLVVRKASSECIRHERVPVELLEPQRMKGPWKMPPETPHWRWEPVFCTSMARFARKTRADVALVTELLEPDSSAQFLGLHRAARQLAWLWLFQELPKPSLRRFGLAPDVASAVASRTSVEMGSWPRRVANAKEADLVRRAIAIEEQAAQSPLLERWQNLRG